MTQFTKEETISGISGLQLCVVMWKSLHTILTRSLNLSPSEKAMHFFGCDKSERCFLFAE